MSRLGKALAWFAAGTVSLVAGSFAFLASPVGRNFVRERTTALLEDTLRGELRVAHFESLDWGGVVARGIEVFDVNGTRVIVAERFSATWDLRAILGGTIRIKNARVSNATVRWIPSAENEAIPTLVDAFMPKTPSVPGGNPVHVLVDEVVLRRIEAYGDAPGFAGFRARLDGEADVDAEDDVVIGIDRLSGVLTEPYDRDVRLELRSSDLRFGDESRLRIGGTLATAEGDAANVRFESVSREAGTEIDLNVDASRVTTELLRAAHLPIPDSLRGTAHGTARLFGPVDAMRIVADLVHEGGPAHVEGVLRPESTVDVTVTTPGFVPHELVDAVPLFSVAGRARAIVPIADRTANIQIEASLQPFTFDEWQVPALEVHGDIAQDSAHVSEVRIDDATGRVVGSGRIGFDGDLDLRFDVALPHVEREPNVRALIPGLRGSLRGRVRLFSDGQHYDVDTTDSLRDVFYEGVSAETLELRGRVHGTSPRPRVDATIRATGVTSGVIALATLDATVRGGPSNYRLDARLESRTGERAHVVADASFDRTNVVHIDAPELEIETSAGTWRGDIVNLRIDPAREVSIDSATLASGNQRAEVRGAYRFDGTDSSIEAQVQSFDVRAFSSWLPARLKTLAGSLDLHAVIRNGDAGTTAVIAGAVRDAAYPPFSGVQAVYNLSYEPTGVVADAFVDLGEFGGLTLTGSAVLDPSLDLSTSLIEGTYDVEARAESLELSLLHLVDESLRPMSGTLLGVASFRGSIEHPVVVTMLDVSPLRIEGQPPLNIHIDSRVDEARATISGSVTNRATRLLEATANLDGDLAGFLRGAGDPAQLLRLFPWRLEARVPELGTASLPRRWRRLMDDIPLGVAATAYVSGGPAGIDGAVDALVKWTGNTDELPCARDTTPLARMNVRIANDSIDAEVAVDITDDITALLAHASTNFSLRSFIETGRLPEQLPRMRVDGSMPSLDLALVPIVCEVVRGTNSGQFTLANMLSDDPSAELMLRATDLSVTGSTPTNAELSVRATPRAIVAEASLSSRDGDERADLQATMEASWPRTSPLPTIEPTARFLVLGRFVESHIAPFLVVVPGLRDADLLINGELQAQGTRDDLTWAGDLRIDDGHLELSGPGQRLDDVRAEVHFTESRAEIRRLEARDVDGRASATGRIDFVGILPNSARLALEVDAFPIRREGSIVVRLSGAANVDADIRADRTDTRVNIDTLTVALPDDTLSTVQDLTEHPDIAFEGTRRRRRLDEEPSYPFHVAVRAPDPFWVRRSDFAVQVTTSLDVRYEDPNLHLEGNIRVVRGFFEIFGKRLQLQRGSILFDGSADMNPVVDIAAVYSLPGDGTKTVTINVSGRLEDPRIEFASTETTDRAEIIALLVSGRRNVTDSTTGQQAGVEQQAASFLAGITAGILTLGLRRELGDFAPVIALESGDTLGSARARFGFQADEVIRQYLPGLTNVIQGAYFEGFVSTPGATSTTTASGSTSSSGGFLVELRFPYSIVQTTTFRTPANLGIDITWEP
jgi:autotransporter translocation and assembly factor TamB